MDTNGKLYKTSEGAVIGGVLQGLSEVYGFDVSLVRIIAVLLVIFGAGSPTLIYIIFWIFLPDKTDVIKYTDPKDDYSFDNDDYYYD